MVFALAKMLSPITVWYLFAPSSQVILPVRIPPPAGHAVARGVRVSGLVVRVEFPTAGSDGIVAMPARTPKREKPAMTFGNTALHGQIMRPRAYRHHPVYARHTGRKTPEWRTGP
jgi:hypothetical protein